MKRELLSRFLRRTGSALFSILTGCEERSALPRISRWLKLALAGAWLTIIAACAKKPPLDQGLVTCYEPVAVYPRVSEIVVKPNPTKGADSVTVTAKARLENASDLEIIASAQCIVDGDTIRMIARDGAFDENNEELIGRIYVKKIKTDSTQVFVKVDSKTSGWGIGSTVLRVTDK